MTVAQLRAELSNDEWQRWAVYYARRAQEQELELLKAKARR